MKKGEILKLEVAYKNKYASNLEEDIAKYAKNRNEVIAKRFVREGIMKEKVIVKEGEQRYFWDSRNVLGKRSMKFFMKLVSGLPLRYMLYKEVFRK